jgi:hypothetical protein
MAVSIFKSMGVVGLDENQPASHRRWQPVVGEDLGGGEPAGPRIKDPTLRPELAGSPAPATLIPVGDAASATLFSVAGRPARVAAAP